VPTPSVTIILAVLDEAESIDACLGSLAAQDYPGDLTVVVADGGSGDDTRIRIAAWMGRVRLTVIDNPRRRQAFGLNLAAAASAGEILVRADGHTTYAPDYVSTVVRALEESGAGAAGGPMTAVGSTRFGAAVAAAMRSPFATGPGRFHRTGAGGDVDTVYLGAFRRDTFMELGGYRALPSGAGEDADFYFRMRRRGLRIRLDPAVRSEYRPRQRVGALWLQHFRYGRAKAELLWANGVFPSLRPLGPALLVAALVAGIATGPMVGWWPLGMVGAAWLLVLGAAAATAPRLAPGVMLAAAVMHLAYGLGLWWGLLRGPQPVRRALRSEAQLPM